ncbi:MAG: hypothetical protein IKH96_09750 [Ruminococcus sp.]|uniref:hypothetical protein n=1 Tax=Ruminococcus sp. TaxID=41978 RepID=UPI0025E767D9|nr:hypothetical protein [Ruminococcus sp.]MBR6996284.1 hypothetical protein [Ruminococcus sp.]
MNKKLKQDIRDSFNFPDAKHKYEFLTQAEVASAQEEKRKYTIPVVFRVTAAAAAAALAIGLWTNLRSNPDPRGGGFREGSVIVTEAVSAQPVTTADTAYNGTAETSYNGASVTTAQAVTSYAGNNTAGTASPALGAGSQTTAHRSSGSRTTAAVTGRITTTTTVNKEIERSFEMKKLLPFTAALMILTNAAATSVHAAISEVPRSFAAYEAYSSIEAMESGEFDTDINMDGKFDIKDCVDLFAYVQGYGADDEIAENIASVADYNQNGHIDSYHECTFSDADYLMQYYIISHEVTFADLGSATYEKWDKTRLGYLDEFDEFVDEETIRREPDKFVTYEDFEAMKAQNEEEALRLKEENGWIIGHRRGDVHLANEFSKNFSVWCEALRGLYSAFKENIENGRFDYDVNGDGELTYEDGCIYELYKQQRLTKYEKSLERIINGVPTPVNFRTSITDEQWERSEKLYNNIERMTPINNEDLYYVWYLIERDGKPEAKYMDNDYYDSFLPSYSFGVQNYGTLVRGAYDLILPENEYCTMIGRDFSKDYDNFITAYNNGEVTLPDPTCDGVINEKDIYASDIFLSDRRNTIMGVDSDLLPEIIDVFENHFDLNGNGFSGDIYDISIYQIVIVDIIESSEGHTGILDNYQDKIMTYREELRAEMGIMYAPVIPVPEINMSAATSAMLNDEIDRSGDANCDGETDLADAIFIMQSMANPDKYDISERGRFNGDVYETGHGITANDALEIQNTLLHKDN